MNEWEKKRELRGGRAAKRRSFFRFVLNGRTERVWPQLSGFPVCQRPDKLSPHAGHSGTGAIRGTRSGMSAP